MLIFFLLYIFSW